MSFQQKKLLPLFGATFLDQTYLTITFPLITLIFFDANSRLFSADADLSTRSFWYGCCVALPNIINMVFAPSLSILSDHFGRKKILLIEIFCAFIFTTTVGLGVYLGYLWLIFIGFTIKGAFCRINPTALAIVGDLAPKNKKILYMGYLQFAISLGAALGPFLGGYLAMRYFFAELNFSLPFFLAAVLAALNTCYAAKFLQESRRLPTEKQILKQAITKVFLHKEVVKISLLLLLIQLSWSAYYQFIPPILKQAYHLEAAQIGSLIASIAVWLALTTGLVLPALQRSLGVQQLLLTAILLMLFGYAMTLGSLLWPSDLMSYVVWVGAAPIAAGDVIAYSCLTALYSNSVSEYEQGKVMGVAFVIVAAIWAATGFIGGILMGVHLLLPLILAPVGILAALVLMQFQFVKTLVLSETMAG